MSGDGPEALDGLVTVSRETAERLTAYVALLRKWQPAENLVAPSTLDQIWARHIADSAQLINLFPADRTWIDVGSGAGFPGLVVAIAGPPGTRVALIESNRRKCAFLRAAIRETGAPATVHEGRAEAVLAAWNTPADRVSARALAPLAGLLKLTEPVLGRGIPAAFHKGRGYRQEIAEASQSYAFDLVEHPSRLAEGVILEISRLRRKVGGRDFELP